MNFDRMRALLLEQAVQGKLVPQLEDEPTVEQIGEAPEDVPFAIPDKWKWCNSELIQTLVRGITFPSSAKETIAAPGLIRCLTTGSVQRSYRPSSDVFIAPKFIRRKKQLLLNGDVVISSANSRELVGKNISWNKDENDVSFGGFLTIARTSNELVLHPEFLSLIYQYLFETGYFANIATQTTNIANLTNKKLNEIPFPIPPLTEQRRIVAKLEESFAEIDRAEKAFRELQTLASVLRGKILQEAVMGKLVPRLDDEPAVEQIGEVPEDVPFEIPSSWSWKKLEDIFKFVDYRGKTPIKLSDGVRLVTASNVRKGYMDHARLEYISTQEYATRQTRGVSKKGDILFTTEAPMGNVALADLDEFSVGQRVITLQSSQINRLLMYFMLSPFFQASVKEQATGTTAQGIKAARLKKLYLPIPPLEEQGRIAKKIDDLMKQVERLVG